MVTYLVCGSCGSEFDSRDAASVATVASRRDDGWIAISCRDCGHAAAAAAAERRHESERRVDDVVKYVDALLDTLEPSR